MPVLTCNSCNKEFIDDVEQKLHYKSDWHRYNLKRKIAGVPGVTEELFIARQSAIAEEKSRSNESPMLYSCGICNKGYRSAKAHEQHLNSRSHVMRASQGLNDGEQDKVIIKPLRQKATINEESDDEWEEIDADELLVGEASQSLTGLNVNEAASDEEMDDSDDDFEEELDPSCCFMCDQEHDTIESCVVHLHKKHGFFIPDIEYLKDFQGLLTYLGLKVKRDFICLYCNEQCHPFSSLEAVRKHMAAKSHCKLRYGDGGDDEEAELEDFYDYSNSYMDEDGTQLVAFGETGSTVELGGGSELIISSKSDNKTSTRTLGSREFLRYYRQRPRPSSTANTTITAALASRYKSMGLSTVQSREHIVRMKVLKEMKRSDVDNMRSKIAMKSNVIRNLPNNVPY